MKSSPMSNTTTTKLSIAQLAITLFRWDWDSNQYVPLMWPYHLQLLQQIQLMSALKFTELNTYAIKSMTYWIEIILSTSIIMIIVGCQTSSRLATKFGYICRSVSLGLIAIFACSDMGLTPSLRMKGKILLSSSFHHSLACN